MHLAENPTIPQRALKGDVNCSDRRRPTGGGITTTKNLQPLAREQQRLLLQRSRTVTTTVQRHTACEDARACCERWFVLVVLKISHPSCFSHTRPQIEQSEKKRQNATKRPHTPASQKAKHLPPNKRCWFGVSPCEREPPLLLPQLMMADCSTPRNARAPFDWVIINNNKPRRSEMLFTRAAGPPAPPRFGAELPTTHTLARKKSNTTVDRQQSAPHRATDKSSAVER